MNLAALSLIALAHCVGADVSVSSSARPASVYRRCPDRRPANLHILAWGMSMAVVAAIGCYIVFGLLWG